MDTNAQKRPLDDLFTAVIDSFTVLHYTECSNLYRKDTVMSKKGFYVQLHLHTSETSKCGRASGAEMARACKAAGYDLIAITDHFFNANIACEQDIPWADKVEFLFRGYYAAKEEGDRIGLEVIRGWETYTSYTPFENGEWWPMQRGPELLTYGLDEKFLLAHPDIDKLPYYDYIRLVKEAGGRIIHAHPYRRRPYIPIFAPDPASVEAYEVYNRGNAEDNSNHKAYLEAKQHGLLMFAGCDAHSTETVGAGAVRFVRPVHTIDEIFDAARNGESQIIETLSPAESLL